MKFRMTKYPEREYDYDDIRLRYVDIGEGEPLLFIHGLGSRIERRLSQTARTFADARGQGVVDVYRLHKANGPWLASRALDDTGTCRLC